LKKCVNNATNARDRLEKKKPSGKESNSLQTKHALERLNLLESEVAALLDKSESTHDPFALTRCVEMCEQAVELAPIESSRHGMAVINLCNVLGLLYRSTADKSFLRRAGEVVTYWLKAIPIDDWRLPLYLLAAGVATYHNAFVSESETDEDNAIAALENVRSTVKPGAGVYCTSSSYLAELRLKRYERTWNLKDLEVCIVHTVEVLDAPRALMGERQNCCRLFVQAMFRHYEVLGSISDIDAAIEALEMFLKNDLSRDEKAKLHALMGTALRFRFNELRDRADLDRGIDCYRHLIKEAGDDTTRAMFMDNFANALADRYRITGNMTDLNDAIASSRAAHELLPEKSPHQARTLGNLGTSMFERFQATRDPADLSEAVTFLRRGLGQATSDLDILQRLHAMLARSILHQATASASPGNLIRDGLDHFAKVREITSSLGKNRVSESLFVRERTLWITDMEIGALVWLSKLDPSSAPELLRRALEVGEAAKSWALAEDMARRPLPRPSNIADELFERERWLLGQLSALDNSEFSETPWTYQIRNTNLRDNIQRELNLIWADIAKASPAGMRYVKMRQSPDRGWLESIHQLNPSTAILSVLPLRSVRSGSSFEDVGLVVLCITPERATPFIIAENLMLNCIPSAVRQFEAEVPGDGGLGMRLETWHRPLQELLGNQTPDPIKKTRTIIVSPPRDGHNLPWHLILQRVGWHAEDGRSLPVVTLPTLAVILQTPITSETHVDEKDKLAKRMMYVEPLSVEEAFKQVMRMAGEWSGPLVVGNPTKDLPAAGREARTVAAILGAKPLIGPKALKEIVLRALYNAPMIHMAAHAYFDERTPLESMILVADGTISAREIVGSFCEAELVVLSSCEGGTSSRVIGGEVAGLGHALLRAGARAVMASLWPVDDDATAFLMAEFYRSRRSGVDEATALSKAMLMTSEQPLWKHPYFWSGFVLIRGG
jgi:hypothetical protein